jgi:hypothetical protein
MVVDDGSSNYHKKKMMMNISSRNDPDKQLLIYDTSELPSMNAILSSSQNSESYPLLLHPHHKRILKLAETYYDEFLKFVLNNIISQAFQKKIINMQEPERKTKFLWLPNLAELRPYEGLDDRTPAEACGTDRRRK